MKNYKYNKRKQKNNALKILFTIILIIIIAMAIKLIFFNKEKTENIKEVATQNITEDNEKPVITLNGKEKEIVALGSIYNDKKAVAKDNIDGDITDKITIDGVVDTNKIGTYEITYKVKDAAGNESSIKREVKVRNSIGNKGLPVLMYHFFYDKNTESGANKDNNFIEISDFEEQIKYLSENDFYFPTWEEVEEYIDGKTILPEKSVVLTVDDGDDSFFKLAVPVLQKYDVDATSFVITSWYGYRANEKQENVSYQSHSDCMHEGASNGKGVMLSWTKEKIIKDLEDSKKALGGNATIFCYPFGQYNDTGIEALKTAGYKLAFTTQGGRVYKGSSKYELPRVRIMKTTTLSSFKSMVN